MYVLLQLHYKIVFAFLILVEQHDLDLELDTRFLVAASTVFLSMSLKIVSEIVEYIRRNPEIIHIIDRELNKFMVSSRMVVEGTKNLQNYITFRSFLSFFFNFAFLVFVFTFIRTLFLVLLFVHNFYIFLIIYSF